MGREGELRAYPAVPPSHRSPGPRSSSSWLLFVIVATQLFFMGSCKPAFFRVVGIIGPFDVPKRAPETEFTNIRAKKRERFASPFSQPLHPRPNSNHQASVRNTILSSMVYYLISRALPSTCTGEMSDLLPYPYPHIASGGSRSLYSLVGSRPQFLGVLSQLRIPTTGLPVSFGRVTYVRF